MVERPLRMHEVPGSIPGFSKDMAETFLLLKATFTFCFLVFRIVFLLVLFFVICLLLLSLTKLETPILLHKMTHGTYGTMK